jgi:YD repeat-containing protein
MKQQLIKYPALSRSDNGSPFTVETFYDLLGRVIKIKAEGLTTDYRYSGKDRLAARHTGDGRITTYLGYDEGRNLSAIYVDDSILKRRMWHAEATHQMDLSPTKACPLRLGSTLSTPTPAG